VDPAPAESQALANRFKADASMKGDPYEEQHYPQHANLYVAVLIAWRSAEAQQPELCLLLPHHAHSLGRSGITNSPAADRQLKLL
jgi:hypothetical protein